MQPAGTTTASQESRPNAGPGHIRPSLLAKLAPKPWIQAGPKSLLLRDCLVVNPAAGKLLEGPHDILIKQGKIVAVEQAGSIALDDAREINLGGKYVCPGLIDCHVHVTAVPGVMSIEDLLRTSSETIHLRTTYVLREMLQRGFTTVRDTGGATKHLANALEEGLIEGPRLYQCGKAMSQTGGHGDLAPGVSGGGGPGCCAGHSSNSIGRVADGVPQVLQATREELKAGADFIKVMCGGGVATPTDAIETVQFTAEEVQAITAVCRSMGGKLSTAHAYTVEAIRHAIDNGMKGIEHGNLLDKATAEYMAEKGIYLTPTLSCHGILTRPPFDKMLPPSGQAKNQQVMHQGVTAIKLAEEAGVTVCYGSDLLSSMHALQTLEFTVRAGILPSPTVLRHATTNAAKMLGMQGQLGTISQNAIADVIILDANPLDDVTILDCPEMHLKAVLKEGRVVMSGLEGLSKD